MNYLQNERILVTGGTGFVGSHLVKELLKQGAPVFVPYRSMSPYSYFSSQHLEESVTLISCDIKDSTRVFDCISKYEISLIYHLAAQPIVTTAYINPKETYETNIMGTVNILEAARRVPSVRRIIVASSDKSYGESREAYTEETPLSGDHPYEVSKAATDLIAESYFKTYTLPVVITRFGNIYGEGDVNFTRIIPGIFKSLILKEELVIRSNGKYIREYLSVRDVVQGYLMLAMGDKKVDGEAFNFGSDYHASVVELIGDIERILEKRITYSIANSARNEIPTQRLIWKKAKKELGWNPKATLKTEIPKMYAWYTRYFQ